jgi:hypothetical protein
LFRGSFGRQNQASWDEQAFNNGKFKYVGKFPLQSLGAGVADVPDAEKDRVYKTDKLREERLIGHYRLHSHSN